jgi:hypothetical protein
MENIKYNYYLFTIPRFKKMESTSAFPFRKLRYEIYLTLDVMMHIEQKDAYKFMFTLNKDARKFIVDKFITVRNGFVNDGLIDFCFGNGEL